MKSQVDTIVNEIIPSITDNFSVGPQSLQPGKVQIVEGDQSWMSQSSTPETEIPQGFSLVFEDLQAIGLKINERIKESGLLAQKSTRKGIMNSSSSFYDQKVGQVISDIKTQVSLAQSLEENIKFQHRAETILISIDGVQTFLVRRELAEWVVENPYLAANIISVAATCEEVSSAGLEGKAIDTIINVLFQSIKKIGAYCRGEKDLDPDECSQILENILASFKTGFLRGLAIKIIHKLMDGSAFAALGFTVGIDVIPTLIKVLKDEMTLEEALTDVEPRMLISAVITTIVILFKTLGTALLSASVINAIWEEISPEWKSYLVKTETDIGSAIAKGNVVIAISGVGIIEQKVWQSLSPEQRQAVIDQIKGSTPDQVKIAYNMTLENATKAFDVASGWLGERTSDFVYEVA